MVAVALQTYGVVFSPPRPARGGEVCFSYRFVIDGRVARHGSTAELRQSIADQVCAYAQRAAEALGRLRCGARAISFIWQQTHDDATDRCTVRVALAFENVTADGVRRILLPAHK